MILGVTCILAVAGCSAKAGVALAPSCPDCPAIPGGTSQYVWEEPMVDVVDVPPGLDPEGIYYRPAHKEVVEIRQGRYKYYNPK